MGHQPSPLKENTKGRCPKTVYNFYRVADGPGTQRYHQYDDFKTVITIIIAIVSYWSTGCLQELSKHPVPEPASQAVSSYNKTSLFQPLDLGAKCFFGGLAFSFHEDLEL